MVLYLGDTENMNLPDKFCERMQELLGDEYEAFLTSYETNVNRGIRINTNKVFNKEDFLSKIGDAEQVLWCETGYYIPDNGLSGNHPYHAGGAFYFQEPSAMAVAEGLPLTENCKVLDLCAAPGGKTTHIAARMKNKGLLISNEIIPKRAAVLAENAERMGLTNTIVLNETPEHLAERFKGYFDFIIVDAPCSGEGMFRKEPQAVTEWGEAHTLSCAMRQKNILDDAYRMLKKGGYIMYSTCTFSYDENEKVVEYMIEKYNTELCKPENLEALSCGIGSGMENCRRVFPHKQKGEGHFMALLRRTEENTRAEAPVAKKDKKSESALAEAVKMYREFEKGALNIKCEGEFVLFGDNLYLMPEKINVDKLKVLRCGLHLGVVKRNRFEPAHALSHAFELEAYKNKAAYPCKSDEIKKYMHGETISGDEKGWCVVAADEIVIGWGKGSGGIIKNHYPKALRTY